MSLKHKGKGPQALTANNLREGYVVWLTKDMNWSADYQDVLLSEDEDVIAQMQAQGEKDDLENLVTGVYFIDVDPTTGLPARYRERFRVKGPSYDTAAHLAAARKSQNGER